MNNSEANTEGYNLNSATKKPQAISSSQVIMASTAENGLLHLKIGNELLNATFSFQSKDLIINFGDNYEILIIKYLSQARVPSLVSDTGQFISKDTIFTITKFASIAAESKEDIGAITSTSGTVIVRKANGQKNLADEHTTICAGDMLATVGNSCAALTFADGMTVNLSPSTKLSIDKYDTASPNISLAVLEGELNFRSGQIAKSANSEVIINTPVAILKLSGDISGGWQIDEHGNHNFFAKSNDDAPNSKLEVKTLSGTEYTSSASTFISSGSILHPPSILVGELVISRESLENEGLSHTETIEEKIEFSEEGISQQEKMIVGDAVELAASTEPASTEEKAVIDLPYEEISSEDSKEEISEVSFEENAPSPAADNADNTPIEVNDNFESGESHDIRNVIELQRISDASAAKETYGFTELDSSTPSDRLIEIDGIDYKKLQFKKAGSKDREDLIIEILGDDGSCNHSLVLKEFFAQKDSSVTTFSFAAKA